MENRLPPKLRGSAFKGHCAAIPPPAGPNNYHRSASLKEAESFISNFTSGRSGWHPVRSAFDGAMATRWRIACINLKANWAPNDGCIRKSRFRLTSIAACQSWRCISHLGEHPSQEPDCCYCCCYFWEVFDVTHWARMVERVKGIEPSSQDMGIGAGSISVLGPRFRYCRVGFS